MDILTSSASETTGLVWLRYTVFNVLWKRGCPRETKVKIMRERKKIIRIGHGVGQAHEGRVWVAVTCQRLQHPHSNQAQPESVSEILELRPRESLGHDVGDVVGAGSVGERNFVVIDAASNEEVTECDVLRSLVEFVVLRESNC